MAVVALLSLRGTPVLYGGDEIGLGDIGVSEDRLRDPLGVRYWPAYAGRDPMRTPMPWRDTPGGGFTEPGVEPWLPFGDLGECNVEDQLDEPDSMLTLVRDLLALRRNTPALQAGSYRTLEATDGAWAWSRGDHFVVVANMGTGEAVLGGISGRVRLGTDRRRDGEAVDGTLRIRGWEAIVLERGDLAQFADYVEGSEVSQSRPPDRWRK